ncbi:hypothetical protein BH23GEM9_BH23GEM9_37740 [soil metagenome]
MAIPPHQTHGATLLLALDNVIWKLAPDPAASPAGAVRTLLAQDPFTDSQEHRTVSFWRGPGRAVSAR